MEYKEVKRRLREIEISSFMLPAEHKAIDEAINCIEKLERLESSITNEPKSVDKGE